MKLLINSFKNQYFWLVLILGLAVFVRLYRIDWPLANWHSWRQADTVSVARNFLKEGYNPFLPKYDDMSGVAEKPVPNPGRYRFVEFPVYSSLVYFGYMLFGGEDIRVARGVNILFSLGSVVFLFLISKKYFGAGVGFISGLIYAVLPFVVFFSTATLPESSLVFFCLGMFYFVNRWIYENTTKLFLLGIFFTSFAFLTKPMAVFYLLPLVYSIYLKEKKWWPIPLRYVLFLLVSLLPFGAWRVWMIQHPEGIPASNWLLNGNGIRFRPSFWRWIIADRLGREILTATGSFLFFLGLLIRPKLGESKLIHLLAASLGLYLVLFATGNVQHDYYQLLITPVLAIFTARGLWYLLLGIPHFLPRIYTIPLGLAFFVLMFYFNFMEVRGFYNINNDTIIKAGKAADQILSKEALVVAPYQGDTAFLNQIKRPGFAHTVLPINDLIRKYGVTHYVSVNYDGKTKWLMKKYKVLESNKDFVIINLREENPDFLKLIENKDELTEPG